jgi:hypothetical protein
MGPTFLVEWPEKKLLRENINISHFIELSSPQPGVALVMVRHLPAGT